MVPNQSQDVYYDYLYTINPIAERIRKDVDATKDAYQSLWYELSVDEQNKILEESIISPETVLRYSKYKKPDRKVSGDGFSWFTHSQLDLCKHVDTVRENFSANECKTIAVKRIGTSKEQQDNKLINKIKSNVLFKSLMPTEDKGKVVKNERTKPKGPPPPPPPPQQPLVQDSSPNQNFMFNVYDDGNNKDAIDIPKTGFDFLDNW